MMTMMTMMMTMTTMTTMMVEMFAIQASSGMIKKLDETQNLLADFALPGNYLVSSSIFSYLFGKRYWQHITRNESLGTFSQAQRIILLI